MNPGHSHDRFPPTHWTLVLAAAAQVADSRAQAAWEELCRHYWFPLYAFIRREGCSPPDAQDLTQEFLTRLMLHHQLLGLEREGGRFRSFLLATLKHFLSDERKRARAQKRGGGQVPVSLDEEDAESRYQAGVSDGATPEQAFERQWASVLIRQALDRLGAQYAARGRSDLFAALRPVLTGLQGVVSYAGLGESLGMGEGAVKTAVHRLRKEFGQELRSEVARTVAHPVEIDAELRRLIEVTAGAENGL